MTEFAFGVRIVACVEREVMIFETVASCESAITNVAYKFDVPMNLLT